MKSTQLYAEINLLMIESDHQISLGNSTPSFVLERCDRIQDQLHIMLQDSNPKFRPDALPSLSSKGHADFIALNNSFHHMALIQTYR
jgi:hypothetical protein